MEVAVRQVGGVMGVEAALRGLVVMWRNRRYKLEEAVQFKVPPAEDVKLPTGAKRLKGVIKMMTAGYRMYNTPSMKRQAHDIPRDDGVSPPEGDTGGGHAPEALPTDVSEKFPTDVSEKFPTDVSEKFPTAVDPPPHGASLLLTTTRGDATKGSQGAPDSLHGFEPRNPALSPAPEVAPTPPLPPKMPRMTSVLGLPASAAFSPGSEYTLDPDMPPASASQRSGTAPSEGGGAGEQSASPSQRLGSAVSPWRLEAPAASPPRLQSTSAAGEMTVADGIPRSSDAAAPVALGSMGIRLESTGVRRPVSPVGGRESAGGGTAFLRGRGSNSPVGRLGDGGGGAASTGGNSMFPDGRGGERGGDGGGGADRVSMTSSGGFAGGKECASRVGSSTSSEGGSEASSVFVDERKMADGSCVPIRSA